MNDNFLIPKICSFIFDSITLSPAEYLKFFCLMKAKTLSQKHHGKKSKCWNKLFLLKANKLYFIKFEFVVNRLLQFGRV